MKLYYIDIGYACFGIMTDGSKCIIAAPIARWMVNRTLDEIIAWVKSKKGTIKELSAGGKEL